MVYIFQVKFPWMTQMNQAILGINSFFSLSSSPKALLLGKYSQDCSCFWAIALVILSLLPRCHILYLHFFYILLYYLNREAFPDHCFKLGNKKPLPPEAQTSYLLCPAFFSPQHLSALNRLYCRLIYCF